LPFVETVHPFHDGSAGRGLLAAWRALIAPTFWNLSIREGAKR
jgi:hypothetical protein